FAGGRFRFLNQELDFSDGIRWKDAGTSPLWRFHLQYLGAVLDHGLCGRAAEASALVSAWSHEFGTRWDVEAWHPYPTSLRLANLCHAAAALGGFNALGPDVHRLVGAHAAFILAHLERDLRGNHLLENLRALLVASRFLRGELAERCARVARPLFAEEIAEQVLAAAGHFERSPMCRIIVPHRALCL